MEERCHQCGQVTHTDSDKMPTHEQVLDVVKSITGFGAEAFYIKNPPRDISVCKHIYFYIAYYYTHSTLADIALSVDTTHPTVLYGRDKVEGYIATYWEVKEVFNDVIAGLLNKGFTINKKQQRVLGHRDLTQPRTKHRSIMAVHKTTKARRVFRSQKEAAEVLGLTRTTVHELTHGFRLRTKSPYTFKFIQT